jgi:group I intron endonuclease
MEELLEKYDAHNIKGVIYKIINKLTNKMYVGQTRTHYLNHGKYRPFGHIGRFKHHISESKSKKTTSCSYLNSAFNKYGVENFACELIIICEINELDDYEIKYINELNTKYPNGYNLTNGGQGCGYNKGKKIKLEEVFKPKTNMVLNENLKRSDKTNQLISLRLKEFKKDPTIRENEMRRAQKQHLNEKFNKYKETNIDNDNIDKYISVIKNNTLNYEYVRITFGKMRTTFVGKYESIEQIKERARQFILDIIKWQHDQIAGSPLEPI